MKCENSWKSQSLRELATINYGRSPAAILAEDGLYPVVGTGGSERLGNDYLHDGESIILGRKGTIDRVYFATGRFWTIDTAYYLTGFGESVPRWLFYYLQTPDLRQMNEATGVPSLSRDLLYKIEIPTPSKPEQTKIAEILSMVDRAIEQTEALIAKQQHIKTGLMQDLLTRGIDEHGNLRSERTHQFKDSPSGRIPVEWEATTLGHIGIWSSGGTPSKTNPKFWSGEIPWVSPKDMKFFDLKNTIDTITDVGARFGSKVLPEGTIFIVIRGMILAHTFPVCYATRPMAFNQDVKAIIVKPGIIARYAAYWLVAHEEAILKIATTATHGTKRFDMDDLYNVDAAALPQELEQQQIIQLLDEYQWQIVLTKAQAEKLLSLKTALMQDLLTGKKRVTALLTDTEAVGV